MTSCEIYNLIRIDHIINDGFTLELPQETVDMINKISDIVGATNYVKTPVFHKKAKNKNKSSISNEPVVPRPVVEKTKVEGLKSSIQESLNKMTEKTYSIFEEKIMLAVSELNAELNDDETFLNDVTLWIFDLATINRFSSNEYINLIMKLQEDYNGMMEVFKNKIDEFLKSFDNIESANPDEEYEKFCKLKSQGEKRKTLSLLIVNLFKRDMYSLINLEDMIIDLIDTIYIYYKKDGYKASCEDIADNIHVIVSNATADKLKTGTRFQNIVDKIINIKDLNKNENPSHSNKTKFRLMDILDCLKK